MYNPRPRRWYSKLPVLLTADNAVQGSEANIEFNSFVNYDPIMISNLDEEGSEDIDSLLAEIIHLHVTADTS